MWWMRKKSNKQKQCMFIQLKHKIESSKPVENLSFTARFIRFCNYTHNLSLTFFSPRCFSLTPSHAFLWHRILLIVDFAVLFLFHFNWYYQLDGKKTKGRSWNWNCAFTIRHSMRFDWPKRNRHHVCVCAPLIMYPLNWLNSYNYATTTTKTKKRLLCKE